MKNPKPTWWLLYTLLPVAIALLVAANRLSPSAGWRVVAECSASLTVICLMALWLRANRMALVLRDASGEHRASFRAWVAYCPPRTPRRHDARPAIDATQDWAA